MAFSRRKFLLGLGGAAVGLPFLEGLAPKTARADVGPPPFALFYRRGNGVQQAILDRNDYLPANAAKREVERWWPLQTDNPTPPNLVTPLATFGATSALSEIEAYVSRTTVIRGLRHPYGTENGHPEGAAQGLTGAGVKYLNDSPNFQSCAPLGESLDNRIARELTPANPESLYLGVKTSGATGVSYLRVGATVFPRAAEENLLVVYNQLFLPFAEEGAARELLVNRRKSVNDLVRADITALRNDPRLSAADKNRLELHLQSIRDTELALSSCVIPETLLGEVQTYNPASITATVNVLGKLAALAISCGVRRSVVVNIGVPQDIISYSEVPGAGGYEFHALSHRQSSESNTNPFDAARDLHHQIDRYHLKQFKSILDALDAYKYGPESLLDRGVAVHFSDLGSGQHIVTQLPYIYVGGAQGKLKTGLYANIGKDWTVRFLNTIGAAVGCKNGAGDPLDDFNADNNNYLTKNYCWNYYDVPQPPTPTNGKPPITGRIATLINA